MSDLDQNLDGLLQRYRAACPEIEPSANFMPNLWARIEKRNNPVFLFQRIARPFLAAAGALCLLLGLLNALPHTGPQPAGQTYADALAADETASKIAYTEAVHGDDLRPPLDLPQ